MVFGGKDLRCHFILFKVIDLETGARLGPGQLGRFCFKTPLVMKARNLLTLWSCARNNKSLCNSNKGFSALV